MLFHNMHASEEEVKHEIATHCLAMYTILIEDSKSMILFRTCLIFIFLETILCEGEPWPN